MRSTLSSPSSIPNKAISAAAGSGKTFQLIHRYVGILCYGVEPEKIIALTFTRKAAGEIFDRIIRLLREAAGGEESASIINRQLHDCQAVPPDFNMSQMTARKLLRKVLQNMHLCRIGTLDSFLFHVVQSFPFEFGISGNLSILEGHSAMTARQQTLREIMQQSLSSDKDKFKAFLESFKQATFGEEEKRFSESLDSFVDKNHAQFMEVPDGKYWGNPDKIWTEGCSWLKQRPESLKNDLEIIYNSLTASDVTDNTLAKCLPFFEALNSGNGFSPEGSWPQIQYLFPRLLAQHEEIKTGQATIKLNRKEWQIAGEECRACYRVISFVMAEFLRFQMERTRGLHQILEVYDEHYRQSVRQQGKATFTDIAFLANSGTLTQDAEDANVPDKLYIDYRLDCHHDHWLIDEFQDTSLLQWHAIENLIDEIIQDTSGQRSFFYVGDVKQAIYSWRGGEPRLFKAILDYYNSDPGSPRIRQIPLIKSFRSAVPVIDTVNNIFETFTNRDLDLPGEIYDRWDEHWQPHQTARQDIPGYAAMLSFQHEKKDQRADEKRYRAALDIINEVKPLERGLSSAVLVRTNAQGEEVVDLLRSNAVPVSFEGSVRILDNNFIATLTSLLKLTQHPGDNFAWKHLEISPLEPYLPKTRIAKSSFIAGINREIHYSGFEKFLLKWIRSVDDKLTDFERYRARQLLEAAREYDGQSSGRRVTDFIDFLSEYEINDPTNSETVQVMTVHKAKGLQFDLVILPAMDSANGITSVGSIDIHIKRSDDIERRPEWLLKMPKKEVAENDSELNKALKDESINNAYEELCTLYVALTRAKHALYIIRNEPTPNSKTIRPSTIVANGLNKGGSDASRPSEHGAACLYQCGQPDWFEKLPQKKEKPESETEPQAESAIVKDMRSRNRYPRRTPSDTEAVNINAAALFPTGKSSPAMKGTLLHKLLSRIKWREPQTSAQAVIQKAVADGSLSRTEAELVEKDFRHLLEFPSLRQVFTKPSADAEVLREYPFEIILNDEWVSGIFDRVVLKKTIGGGTASIKTAEVIDFKTTTINNETELASAIATYKPQLQLYKQVLSQMYSLPASKIETCLLFTSDGSIVRDIAD